MAQQTAREIDREAADWAARADRGLSAEEESVLDAWLAQDTRRLGAYGRYRAVALHSDRARALGPNYRSSSFRTPKLSRRRLLWGGGAMAASVAAAVGVGVGLDMTQGVITTRKGEVRVVPLADGSVMTLNTDSRIKIAFTDDRRSIKLLSGEALFDVAKDPTRPFVVDAGETSVTAIGTSFTVSRLADRPVQVLVREGVVAVGNPGSSAATLRAAANTRVVSAARTPPIADSVPADQIGRETAWQDGRLSFEGETLASAAAEFARYSNIRIVIDDPAIASEEIAGLFQANDPVGFVKAVAASLDLDVTVGSEEVRLSAKRV